LAKNRKGLAFRSPSNYTRVTDAGGQPKRRAGVGVNVSWRRNKQKAFTFVSPQARHYFCFISSHETGRAEAYVLAAFLCFVSLAGQRNEKITAQNRNSPKIPSPTISFFTALKKTLPNLLPLKNFVWRTAPNTVEKAPGNSTKEQCNE
jgi:hypothetical protein